MTRIASFLLLVAACGSSHGRDPGGSFDASARDGGARRDAGARRDSGSDAGASGWASCETNPECVVAPASCCGACGAATPMDMVGVNQSRLMEQRSEACTGAGGCPECFTMQDPFLIATCDLGACRAIDLHTHPATACAGDDDCFLWSPRCCDCGTIGRERAIAISDTGMLAALTCDVDAPACPPCAPTFGPELFAYCDPAGHCAVGP